MKQIFSPVSHGEVHGKCSEAAIACQSERWMFVENLTILERIQLFFAVSGVVSPPHAHSSQFVQKPIDHLSIEVDANVRLHIFWTVVEHLQDLNTVSPNLSNSGLVGTFREEFDKMCSNSVLSQICPNKTFSNFIGSPRPVMCLWYKL